MQKKLVLSISSIAAILLLSCIISVLEYRNMSTYVSDLISKDIQNINVARKLSDVAAEYNLDILELIGEDSRTNLPDFDASEFTSRCDSLRSSLSGGESFPLADSVEYSYAAFMLTSLELNEVLLSDFIDSRSWYFDRLQPHYARLTRDIDNLSDAIYNDLQANSKAFDDGFYRTLIPGIVAVGICIVLVLLLLFYLNSYYAKPVCGMLGALKNYKKVGKKYACRFDGRDELSELNESISDLVEENEQLVRRISIIKDERKVNK